MDETSRDAHDREAVLGATAAADREWSESIRGHAEWVASEVKAGRRASLARADLRGADLTGAELREADLAGADLKDAVLVRADLRGAHLCKANLQGACLSGAKLARADLRGALLLDADLGGADARAADLRGVECRGADLSGTILHEANLQDADLGEARGLVGGQLGGTNVAGARLPEAILKFEGLANVQESSKNAQNVFASLLLLCVYTWLTVAATKDAQLLNNAAPPSSRLPILGTDIPLVRFYLVVPVLLGCLYLYFHLGLQRLWEELADLPAIFPDGRPLDKTSYPWLLNGLVRVHVVRLRECRSALVHWQERLSILAGWGLVPLTLLLVWGRYLSAHDWVGTIFHVALLSASIGAGSGFLHLAGATLRGEEHRPFLWRRALHDARTRRAGVALATAALFLALSVGAIEGVNPHLVDEHIARDDHPRTAADPRVWVPRAFGALGFDTFATLDNADLSTKPATWTGRDQDVTLVKGADLGGRDLRYADAFGAFLANAYLRGADLRGADLREADLRGADLRGANLRGANLRAAKLARADLRWTILPDTNFREADLRGARLAESDLRGVDFRDADLRGAGLAAANLAGADFRRADLREADLAGATGRPDLIPVLADPGKKALARRDDGRPPPPPAESRSGRGGD